MTKSHRRHRPAKARPEAPQLVVNGGSRSDVAVQREPRDPQHLVRRILDTPQLARAVPQLQPEVLHRVIQTCGLEDCADLVALAAPEQLARVFDLDLWSARRPGLDEDLDADRFGVWLQVLMESGPDVAAAKLAGMEDDVVIAALAQHVRVFDRAAVSPAPSADGDEVIEGRRLGDGAACEIGQYLVESRRAGAWDVIVDLLIGLDADHPDAFHRLMRGCRRLSNSDPEADGFHDLLTENEQDMFDLATAREARREEQGYVAPAQAAAFLHMARRAQHRRETPPATNPIAAAYFRTLDPGAGDAGNRAERASLPASGSPRGTFQHTQTASDDADAIASLIDVLADAGVLAPPPRALLDAPQGGAPPRLARIHAHIQFARDADAAAFGQRTGELAYLANTLAAGCSIQARSFTPREASDVAIAVCNLGLENWPHHWRQGRDLRQDFLVDHDLISVFQVGWTVLHEDVCMYAAQRLITVLSQLQCGDREIQSGLEALRMQLARQWRTGAPWHAREALDVLAILDMPAWAALLGLIAECPVIHAALGVWGDPRRRAVSATAFEFISENSQIAAVHAFMESLPAALGG